MSARPSFTALPTEILQAIFLYLDPPSLVSTAQTSRFIKELTVDAPIIWRHYCLAHFKQWSPSHQIEAKLAAPVSAINWRQLYGVRKTIEIDTLRCLNRILDTQQARIANFNEVADHGLDAIETLRRECACADDARDVLARRYYANALIERIQRERAISVWKAISDNKHVPIERALGAFDVFTRVGEDVDLDIVTKDVDGMAKDFLKAYSTFHEMDTRRKASTLASWFREQGFTGVPEASYYALRNSFIGLALRSPNHQSLPLISVAVYCALASRLGLDARPCGMLGHVYCLVYAPKDYDLDGRYKPTSSTDLDFMYLDPFQSSDEVDRHDLQRTLREMGVPSSQHEGFLSHTSIRAIAIRTARNIINSVQMIRQTEAGVYGINANWLNTYPDMDASFYAAIWALLILNPSEEEGGLNTGGLHNSSTRRRQYLPYLLEHFQTHYPWDVSLLQQYVIPLFYNQPEGHRLLAFVQSMYNTDSLRKPQKARDLAAGKVNFTIGELFKHKRYDYEGVITGWDPSCDAGEEWIQHMGVDRLPNGRNQSFYHVL